MSYPILYTLTDLTGKQSNVDRTFVTGAFEIKRRHAYVLALSALPAFTVAGILFPFLDQYAIFVFFLVLGGIFFLSEYRSQKGLKLRAYETVFDKQRSIDGEFIVCGRLIREVDNSFGWVYCASAVLHHEAPTDEVDDLYATSPLVVPAPAPVSHMEPVDEPLLLGTSGSREGITPMVLDVRE